jgi:pimeloyl-ACP methyl ester carboxylesterase
VYSFFKEIDVKYNALLLTIILLFIILALCLVASAWFTRSLSKRSAIDFDNAAISFKAHLLDPNPKLIDKSGNLIQNVTLASNVDTTRNGTTADGISKLLIKFVYNSPLKFSIEDKTPNDISDGTIEPLITSSNADELSSSTIVDAKNTTNGTMVVTAVYTPPDFINESNFSYKTIKVLISDPKSSSTHVSFSPVSIRLYHPPVVLVHGLWENPTFWYRLSNFSQTLTKSKLNVFLADYGIYNATTFDPLAKPKNYGIDSLKNITSKAIEDYHKNGTAASQVDMVGHSMGGLIIRGFTQQHYSKNMTNYMKGYIHRLITIGTPHFGAPLAKLLDHHHDDTYCPSFIPTVVPKLYEFLLYPSSDTKNCQHPQKLKDILPIDQGGIQALIPGSTAYSNLCKTNVTSYSIVGSWKPNGTKSHDNLARLFQNITGNSTFRLDEDGFKGPNDLQVSLASQAGGINSTVHQDGNYTIPDGSETFLNTIHGQNFVADYGIYYELGSDKIMHDVIALLNSPATKFSHSIGTNTDCNSQ